MDCYQEAVHVISEQGAYGDTDLNGEKFDRDDRYRRILAATDDLRDLVFESFIDDNYKLQIDFKHIGKIASLIAQGMMVQYEHDFKEACELMAYTSDAIRKDEARKRRNEAKSKTPPVFLDEVQF
jgi:hypothetical protein